MLNALRHSLLLLLLATLAAPAAEVELTIFHTNDLHQSLANLPRFAGQVDAWRADHPQTLFLDAGDCSIAARHCPPSTAARVWSAHWHAWATTRSRSGTTIGRTAASG